jgi:hypothetical protein
MRRSERRSTRIRTRWKIKKLITIRVSNILRAPLLNSVAPKAKLIQVTRTTTKHANKSFLSRLGGFFSHFSIGVEGRHLVGWVVSFGGFDYLLLLVVGGARNELGSTLLTLILTPLKTNTQFICGLGCTLLNPTQVILNHFLTHFGFLKMSCQISNLLLKFGVVFSSMEKLTLERTTHLTRRG